MQLREATWRGARVWPPCSWGKIKEACEKGILRKVELYKSPPPFPTDEIYVTITSEYEGRLQVGLIFGSLEHLEAIYGKLKEIIGKPLQAVGEIEIN